LPRTLHPRKKNIPVPAFIALRRPIDGIIGDIPPLAARGNRPLQMTFEQQLNSLIFFHLEEHTSGRHLLQVLAEDALAREEIAPAEGIKKSSYFEAINTRGLEQLIYVFQRLAAQTAQTLPKEHAALGDLVAIDGSYDECLLHPCLVITTHV